MDLVGVEAVVEGLSGFLGDIGTINGALNMLKPPADTLETAFGTLTNTLAGFGREILNVAEVALGTMLRDAIEWTIKQLQDLISAAFDAGAQFQEMNLRLRGFNLQALVDSGMDYTSAMKQAIAVTKEQMQWVMQLAATTPYDATDIGFVFSMSEAFGFDAAEAKKLTESTLDFVAAMGLSGVEAKRVIINLGQMAQRGKITTREMNDLARGSFVPLQDILDRVAVKLGVTSEALMKMISAPGAGVDYKLFMDSFTEMTTQEVRFQGASERMAHTFQGAWENVTQTVRDVIGNFVLLPGILDPVGQVLGDIMDSIGNPDNWKLITDSAQGVGDALAGILKGIWSNIGLDPDKIVGWIVTALGNVSDWITNHGPSIITFFDNLRTILFGPAPSDPSNPERAVMSVQEHLAGPFLPGVLDIVQHIVDAFHDVEDFITNKVIPAFNQIKKWVQDNGPLIKDFFKSLGDIVSTVIDNLFGGNGEDKMKNGGGLTLALNTLKTVMQWIIDHKDDIANFVSDWITFWFYAELIKLAVQGLLTGGFFTVWIGGALALDQVFGFIDQKLGDLLVSAQNFSTEVNGWVDVVANKLYEWNNIGVNIMVNIIAGIATKLDDLVKTVVSMMVTAWNAALAALGLPSIPNPGGGSGTTSSKGDSGKSSLVGSSLSGKSFSSVVSSSSVTNNMNLTIHTQSTKESVISDFALLKSLYGA
jgi:tape measure domain-containing protein